MQALNHSFPICGFFSHFYCCCLFLIQFGWALFINVIFIGAPNPVVMSFMMVDNRNNLHFIVLYFSISWYCLLLCLWLPDGWWRSVLTDQGVHKPFYLQLQSKWSATVSVYPCVYKKLPHQNGFLIGMVFFFFLLTSNCVLFRLAIWQLKNGTTLNDS